MLLLLPALSQSLRPLLLLVVSVVVVEKPARYRLVLTVIRMVIVIDIVIVFNKLVIYCFSLLLLPSLVTSLRFEYLLSRGTMPAIIALGHHVLHFPCYMYKG